MGSAMAANLATMGHRVLGYVRHAERSDALAARGIQPVTALGELGACTVLISMLPGLLVSSSDIEPSAFASLVPFVNMAVMAKTLFVHPI